MIIKYTNSEEETVKLGEKLSRFLEKGDVVLLTGDLGTGKTHFVKGVAKGLGVNDTIISPTFNIFNIYETDNITLNHFDVYRVNDEEEIINIGFDDYVYGDSISIIEWAELIKSITPENNISILIEKMDDKEKRKISFSLEGDFKSREEKLNEYLSN